MTAPIKVGDPMIQTFQLAYNLPLVVGRVVQKDNVNVVIEWVIGGKQVVGIYSATAELPGFIMPTNTRN